MRALAGAFSLAAVTSAKIDDRNSYYSVLLLSVIFFWSPLNLSEKFWSYWFSVEWQLWQAAGRFYNLRPWESEEKGRGPSQGKAARLYQKHPQSKWVCMLAQVPIITVKLRWSRQICQKEAKWLKDRATSSRHCVGKGKETNFVAAGFFTVLFYLAHKQIWSNDTPHSTDGKIRLTSIFHLRLPWHQRLETLTMTLGCFGLNQQFQALLVKTLQLSQPPKSRITLKALSLKGKELARS